MAAINFPAASESPWYNPDNGITYEYIGGTWRSVNQLSDAFDDTYVEVAGDNMTGNLTLGTDKIELKAADGSATFAGDVTTYGTNDLILKTSPTAGVDPTTYSRSGISHNASLGSGDQKTLYTIQTKNTSASIPGPTLSFKSDANSHSGGELQVDIHNGDNSLNADFIYRATGFDGYDKDGNETFSINPQDGAATFAGDVSIGNIAGGEGTVIANNAIYSATLSLTNPTTNNDVSFFRLRNGNNAANKSVVSVTGTRVGIGTDISYNANDAEIKLNADGSAEFAGPVYVKRASGTAGCFVAQLEGAADNTAQINADGSATFVGNIDIVSDSTRGRVLLNKNGAIDVDNKLTTPGAGLIIRNNGTRTIDLNHNGSASFSGNITAGNVSFNLEPDNPDNYTSTTVEGEEQLVYNGPTLDVKERLRNLISRIDAIEANEIIDDATDNSLLLAIAELTSRLNARDATIADLQARITTLES